MSDWLRSARRTWDAITRVLAATRVSSAFFALLPCLYALGVIVYINVGLAKDLAKAFVTANAVHLDPASASAYIAQAPATFNGVVQALNAFVGTLTAVVSVGSVLNVVAIWRKWPGILSFFTWTSEALKCWLLVSYIMLLCSWQSAFSYVSVWYGGAPSGPAYTLGTILLGILSGLFLPAIVVWTLSVSVLIRQRMIFSGE